MSDSPAPQPDRLALLLAELPGLDPLAPPHSFSEDAAALGIEFEPGDLVRLGRFLAMLLHATRHVNLTAVTDPDEAWTRHVLDSLTLLPYLADTNAQRVADVGSGGGLPGLVLASILPAVSFTLIEATGKKARFLEAAAAALKLSNVAVIAERAEIVGRDAAHHRERYDLVCARALGPLSVLLELTIPLARVDGFVLAIKGEHAGEEIARAKQALHLLHSRVVDTARTPSGTIVIIQKQRRTPRLYPRRPGEPKRAPLGGKTANRRRKGSRT